MTNPVRDGRERFPVLAAAASLLIHGFAVVILLTTTVRIPDTADGHRPIIVRLLPALARREPPGDLPGESTTRPPRDDASAERQPGHGNEDRRPDNSADTAEQTQAADIPATQPATIPPDPARAGTLRATLLDQIRSPPAETDHPTALPWTSSGAPSPGVPGVRGWLSAYVGTVAPRAHSWRDNDGSSRGRYVLANGTVICTRRRAPTIDELMNPWKSIAVTMGAVCGHERPGTTDFSDPRIQPPPSARHGPMTEDQ